jgi:curved DNA-binding protein CbpA
MYSSVGHALREIVSKSVEVRVDWQSSRLGDLFDSLVVRVGMSDYYELLGVARDASSASIRSGFKSATLRSHPDKGGTAESFAQVQTAYKTLSNADLRRAYDEAIGVRGAGCSGGAGPASSYGFEYARGGVRVQVHGQTQRRPEGRLAGGRRPREAARAGQRSDAAGELTAEIDRLHRETAARRADGDLIERLAVAFLDRGEYHLAMGRHSHASFDAHEVELLRPERAETKRRLLGLLRALEQEREDPACSSDEGESDDGDDDGEDDEDGEDGEDGEEDDDDEDDDDGDDDGRKGG